MCNRKYTKYPFFYGMYTGAIGRPNLLLRGGLRTAEHLGLSGEAAQNRVIFQNEITRSIGNNFCSFIYHNPSIVMPIWNQLPIGAKDEVTHFGGEVVGGTIVNGMIAKQLVKKLPKSVVFPSIFVMTCHGFMSSIWDRRDGPPPPPPTGGGPGITA